ncbi:MAG: T9SS type A sorting domain-containing protein [Bacteroidales bacterium]|jgi:hypothetical protein|nr:T9SS type A sorting domain-containing protein [Bacteroidales bacterium]
MKTKSIFVLFLAISFLMSNANFVQAKAQTKARAEVQAQAQVQTKTKEAQSSISQKLGQIASKNAQTLQSATHLRQPAVKALSKTTLSRLNSTKDDTPTPLVIPFQEIITFDTNTNFTFHDEYGYQHFGVLFSLTLDEESLLSVKSITADYNKPYFRFISETTGEELTYTVESPVALPAGSYILLIEDGAYSDYSWNEGYLTAEIQIDEIPYTDIALPCNNSFTQTPENTYNLVGYNLTAFKMVIPSNKIFDFSSEYTANPLISAIEIDILSPPGDLNSLASVGGSSAPLSAGTYFILVYAVSSWEGEYWDSHTSLDITLNISENATAQITPISPTPSEKEFLMDESNGVPLYGYDALFYSITVESSTAVAISGRTPVDMVFALYSDKFVHISECYPGPESSSTILKNLAAGTYFLAVIDYAGAISSGEVSSINGVIDISVLTAYSELDFSKNLNIGEEQWGDVSTMEKVLFTETSMPPLTAAYNFNAEAGHTYQVSWDVYSLTTPFVVEASLFKTPNTGDPNKDVIKGSYKDFPTTFGQSSIFHSFNSSAVTNFVLLFDVPQEDVMYKLLLDDITADMVADEETKEFSWVDITLPFISYLYYDTNHNTLQKVDGTREEYLKCFKLALNEKTQLNFVSGWNSEPYFTARMSIYRDEAMTDCVSGSSFMLEGSDIILEAGTWYVVFTDDQYHQEGIMYYQDSNRWGNCLVYLTGTTDFKETTILSLKEALDNPTLLVVDYDPTTLSFTNAGYFLDGVAPIVAGSFTPYFQWEGEAFHIAAYKLVGMSATSIVNIDVYQKTTGTSWMDPVVYIYKKDTADGEYVLVERCSDRYDAEENVEFTAQESIDYYVVVTSGVHYENLRGKTSYAVSIYTGQQPEMPEPEIPNSYLIAGTSTDVTTLELSEGATETEIRIALAALTVTATTKDNQEILLVSNPSAWTITSTSNAQAQFAVVPEPYELAADYTPATVDISFNASIEDKINNKKLHLYTSNDKVNVCGLDGTEQLYLYNMSGKMISRVRATSQVQQFDISSLSRSMYIVLVQKENKLTSLKFVK